MGDTGNEPTFLLRVKRPMRRRGYLSYGQVNVQSKMSIGADLTSSGFMTWTHTDQVGYFPFSIEWKRSFTW